MNSSNPSSAVGHTLLPDLEVLHERVRRARVADPSPEATETLIQDLETAYEELRVADEEVRAQNESINRLLESHRGLQLQQERTMAILPVPILITDMRGVIRSVNAAAAALVGARVARLVGKPLVTLFAPSDRRELRQLVSGSGRDGLPARRTATLVRRSGDALAVEVTASARPPGAAEGEISWIVLAGHEPLEQGSGAVTGALSRLAVLPRRGAARADVLSRAADIVRAGLDDRGEVTVSLGPPLEPVVTVSTSELAQAWDGAQVVVGDGPSVAAFRQGVTVCAPDARADVRWPGLASRVPDDLPVAVVSPIETGGGVVGTVAAYLPTHVVSTEEVVEMFAVTIGGVLRELELHDELETLEHDMEHALSSRAVIDQAKGVIMADRGVSAEEAWQHLVHLSSTQHVKVRDLAELIVASACRRR